jgi:hypothetical protein
MKYQRKFVIKIIYKSGPPRPFYVKDFIKNTIGFYHTDTQILENAKIWRYKKTCENSINLFLKKIDPTKIKIDDCEFEIIEITDNQTLRCIKLNKINKN